MSGSQSQRMAYNGASMPGLIDEVACSSSACSKYNEQRMFPRLHVFWFGHDGRYPCADASHDDGATRVRMVCECLWDWLWPSRVWRAQAWWHDGCTWDGVVSSWYVRYGDAADDVRHGHGWVIIQHGWYGPYGWPAGDATGLLCVVVPHAVT
jgi:hypothetical protein